MNGILLVKKEKGCTSHDVVFQAKKILGEKVGHTGTLDPNATGLLPLLIGKGTLISKYLINHDKTYQAVLKLGEKRDTADEEGNVIETKQIDSSLWRMEKIEKACDKVKGKQKQIPPMYSAIKKNGKKLYEYARKGEKIEVEPREIEIYEMDLLEINEKEQTILFEVSCSKGTYIRSLCETIAENLGTVGYMKELKRTKVGIFDLKDSITIEEVKQRVERKESLEPSFLGIEEFFEEKQSIYLKNKELSHFLNGVKLTSDLPDEIYRIYNENKKFIGLGVIQNQKLKRDIII